MVQIIEHIPWLALAAFFIFVVIPAGWAAMAGFLGLAGAFGPTNDEKHGEAKVGGVSFKGPLRIGLIVLAIIFAYIALHNNS